MKICNHKYPNGDTAIEYCSTYEMRSSDMYCKICKKEGTRKELENEQISKLDVYKMLFKFLLYSCKRNINCGCGCPWGKWIEDKGHFSFGYYTCELLNLNEKDLIESVKNNLETINKILK